MGIKEDYSEIIKGRMRQGCYWKQRHETKLLDQVIKQGSVALNKVGIRLIPLVPLPAAPEIYM